MSDQKLWYEKDGELSGIVCSTGISVSRNLSTYPFPHKISVPDAQKCTREIIQCLEEGNAMHTPLNVIEMRSLGQAARELLYRQDLISEGFAQMGGSQTLLLSEDQGVSAMLMGEDHICLQVLKSGLALSECYREISAYDQILCRKLPIAFDSTYGYLTASLQNLGTGLNIFTVLHLPFLEKAGTIEMYSATARNFGVRVEKMPGEEWKDASVYRVSNRVTLGIREEEAVRNLEGIVRQMIVSEEGAAAKLAASPQLEDRLMRSVGILKYATLLDCAECYQLLSELRLAVRFRLIEFAHPQRITQLYYQTCDALIASLEPGQHDKTSRCRLRAKVVHKALSDC